MSRSAKRFYTVAWSAQDTTGGPLDEVFRALREELPDLTIERVRRTHPGDDDNVWWLTLAEADSDVQIDSAEGGEPPFVLESDTDPARRVATVAMAVTTLSGKRLRAGSLFPGNQP
ncbi:hypothetical protein ABT369_15530 [Dactylosporangium sp. NPDC000244]|uniref:hypothetical protein n=1 Tax=Dactylosporangium sp. NPDC000244 TaxID=3154365 RepID=UPI0033257BB0